MHLETVAGESDKTLL